MDICSSAVRVALSGFRFRFTPFLYALQTFTSVDPYFAFCDTFQGYKIRAFTYESWLYVGRGLVYSIKLNKLAHSSVEGGNRVVFSTQPLASVRAHASLPPGSFSYVFGGGGEMAKKSIGWRSHLEVWTPTSSSRNPGLVTTSYPYTPMSLH